VSQIGDTPRQYQVGERLMANYEASSAMEEERRVLTAAERAELTHDQAWDAALAEQDRLSRAAAERARRILESLERTFEGRVPPRFREARISDYNGSRLEAGVRRIVERMEGAKDGAGLSILGTVGAGKSHLAVAVLRALFVRPDSRSFRWAPMREVLEDHKATFDGSHELSFEYETDPAILVLDDAWGDRQTEYSREVLGAIVASRYDRRLSTWLTANVDLKGLRGADERAASRLLEMNGAPLLLRVADRRRAGL
jgi:DNA replication protein DnaC